MNKKSTLRKVANDCLTHTLTKKSKYLIEDILYDFNEN